MTPETVINAATYRYEFVDDTRAQVWVSPANKVKAKADGSYSLTVKGPGPFQITAGYTGTDGNYKTSDPQTVKITGRTHRLNIPLKYGYTTTVSGFIYYEEYAGATPIRQRGAAVIIETDYGTKIGETVTDGEGNYSVTVSHAGRFKVKASAVVAGRRAEIRLPTTTETDAPNKTGVNLFIYPS